MAEFYKDEAFTALHKAKNNHVIFDVFFNTIIFLAILNLLSIAGLFLKSDHQILIVFIIVAWLGIISVIRMTECMIREYQKFCVSSLVHNGTWRRTHCVASEMGCRAIL